MPAAPTCTVTVAADAAPLKRKNKAPPNPAALRKIWDFILPTMAIYPFKKIRVTPEFSRNNAVTSAVSQTVSVPLPLWKQVLIGTAITLGRNNIFGTDPTKAYGFGENSFGYPAFICDATGRFVYISLTKKF